MEKLKSLSPSQLEKDKRLERDILALQVKVLSVIHILDDYVYMNSGTAGYRRLVHRGREEFFSAFKSGVDCVLDLLQKIRKYYSKKEYCNHHLANMIFNPRLQYKDYFSCNTQAIIRGVRHYKENVLKWEDHSEFEKNDLLRGLCTFFQEMLIDISAFVYEMYQWKAAFYKEMKKQEIIEEDTELFSMSHQPNACRRTRLMAVEILQASRQIVSRCLYVNDMSPVPVAIFQLRQAIEIRMLEILGIASIVGDDGLPKKIDGNAFFNLHDLTNSVIFPIELSCVKKIYSWSNIYVHMAVCSNYWLLDFAQDYLIGFICERPVARKGFYDNMKERIAKYTKTEEKNVIIREHADVDIVGDEEFKKFSSLVKTKGFRAYRKHL